MRAAVPTQICGFSQFSLPPSSRQKDGAILWLLEEDAQLVVTIFVTVYLHFQQAFDKARLLPALPKLQGPWECWEDHLPIWDRTRESQRPARWPSSTFSWTHIPFKGQRGLLREEESMCGLQEGGG